VRDDVLTALKTSVVVFGAMALCGFPVGTNVSEEHTASIFRAEVHTEKQHVRSRWYSSGLWRRVDCRPSSTFNSVSPIRHCVIAAGYMTLCNCSMYVATRLDDDYLKIDTQYCNKLLNSICCLGDTNTHLAPFNYIAVEADFNTITSMFNTRYITCVCNSVDWLWVTNW
jgi:hypothetical protein